MNKLIYIIILFVTLGIPLPEVGFSQTKKVLQTEEQGLTVATPYITRSEYKSISIQDSSDLSKSGSREHASFPNLLSVSSLDAIVKLFGTPESVDRNDFPDGTRFTATLNYDGMMLKYVRRKEGRVRLNTMEIRSPKWGVDVGGTVLRPGMSIDQLSPEVRASIDDDTFLGEEEVDGVGEVRVARSKRIEDRGETLSKNRAQITIHVNREAGTVEVVRFHRIV